MSKAITFRKKWILPRRWKKWRKRKAKTAVMSYEEILKLIPIVERERATASTIRNINRVEYCNGKLDLINSIFNGKNN